MGSEGGDDKEGARGGRIPSPRYIGWGEGEGLYFFAFLRTFA